MRGLIRSLADCSCLAWVITQCAEDGADHQVLGSSVQDPPRAERQQERVEEAERGKGQMQSDFDEKIAKCFWILCGSVGL